MRRLLVTLLALLALEGIAAYGLLSSGALPANADAKPGKLEEWVGKRFLHATLDRQALGTPNPVSVNDDHFIAGIQLYASNCVVCHGAADGQPSNVAKGLYQEPPQFAKEGVEDDAEDVTYWKIAHGIRFTGMPAFAASLSSDQIWEISMFLKRMNALPPAAERVWRGVPSAAVAREGAVASSPR